MKITRRQLRRLILEEAGKKKADTTARGEVMAMIASAYPTLAPAMVGSYVASSKVRGIFNELYDQGEGVLKEYLDQHKQDFAPLVKSIEPTAKTIGKGLPIVGPAFAAIDFLF